MNDRRRTSLFSFPLALALALPLSMTTLACGGDDDDDGGGNNCDESTLTYASFGQQFMTDYCTACHAEDAANRIAPDLDTLERVQAQAARVDARAGTGLTMPPLEPRPSSEERALLAEWIDCGAP